MTKASAQSPPQANVWATAWRWFDVAPPVNLIQVMAAGGIAIVLVALFARYAEITLWRAATVIALLGVIWATARIVAPRVSDRSDTRRILLWIGITLVCAEAITIVTAGEFPRLLYTVVPLISVFYLPRRWSLPIVFGAMAWIWLSFRLYTGDPARYPLQSAVLLLALYVGGFSLGNALLQERRARQETQKLLNELAESNDQLLRFAAEASQLATIRERNRIAREIHDSLGHYLTIVGVQLEKAIVYDGIDHDAAGQALRAAKHLTDKALSEVRNSVGALRETDESFTLRVAMQSLVYNIQDSGLSVDLRWRGDEAGFSQPQLFTLFRVAQEGLTNVQKHARARQVLLDVALDAEAGVLQLSDDGIGLDPQAVRNHGHGLQGLRERVELMNGTLTVGRAPTGGAQLVVRLPKEAIV